MKFAFILLVLIGLCSCTDLKKGDQIISIDEMSASLDSLQTILLNNDYTLISDYTDQANEIDIRIKTNYESDTVDLIFAKKLDAFNIMRKSFDILKMANLQLNSDLEVEKVILEKLKRDIEKGNGLRDKYHDYIAFEKEKVLTLISSISEYILLKEKTLKTFNDIHDEINLFSLSLLNKKKIH
jgi:hypothetical protein